MLNIIPVSQHGITRDQISRDALITIQTLQQAGFLAFVVGGAVRDLLLGVRPKDFDVVTNATPEQIVSLFHRARIIGRRFIIVHVVQRDSTIEVSTFRKTQDLAALDVHGRILHDNEFGSQQEDACRRDFTVNALYYNPTDETIWDDHHGFQDIQARILRIIGHVSQRYREDPVRMLRAVRLATKLDLTIEEKTAAPISRLSSLLTHVPPARLFDEGIKTLLSGHAKACIQAMEDYHLLHYILPSIHYNKQTEEERTFINLLLHNTDVRLYEGKSVSPGFLLAGLLWHGVKREWTRLMKEDNLPRFNAMQDAAISCSIKYLNRFSIPHRFIFNMREIWEMQPRFLLDDEKTNRITKSRVMKCLKLVDDTRFRIGFDFFALRAESGEIPREQAQWWEALYLATPEERFVLIDAMLEDQKQAKNNSEIGNRSGIAVRKRRKRKRKSAAAKAKEALLLDVIEPHSTPHVYVEPQDYLVPSQELDD